MKYIDVITVKMLKKTCI